MRVTTSTDLQITVPGSILFVVVPDAFAIKKTKQTIRYNHKTSNATANIAYAVKTDNEVK